MSFAVLVPSSLNNNLSLHQPPTRQYPGNILLKYKPDAYSQNIDDSSAAPKECGRYNPDLSVRGAYNSGQFRKATAVYAARTCKDRKISSLYDTQRRVALVPLKDYSWSSSQYTPEELNTEEEEAFDSMINSETERQVLDELDNEKAGAKEAEAAKK